MQDNFWIIGIVITVIACVLILIDHYKDFEDSAIKDGTRVDKCPVCEEWVVQGTDYTTDGNAVYHGECWDSMKQGAYPCEPMKFP